ncbi:hypothetical protein KFK09_010400 [Dendrobium nobile]|uniref:Retrovirus-related Pol polyprotein from transposon TNT 1-94 n=1 Tax=Dendrobium nobile TaxID=94219 RepID=A0A8T3BBL5_DENNO|nr:hypothetical protein KFK09_010400 [Dendrobium nobile]
MADEDDAGSRRSGAEGRTMSTTSNQDSDLLIPPQLKFLISNVKNMVPNPLTSDNYSIWRLQLSQHFAANGYEAHLTGQAVSSPNSTLQEQNRWKLVDRNLVSALLATISPPILPYVINLGSAHEVWTALERRLQPTNRSRVIQLKNELHQIQMRDRTMGQYLDQIKTIVDNIAAAGSTVDTEDIVLYILNGLPSAYNSFKTAIRTSMQPIHLDDLYSLLSSEEIILQQQNLKDQIQQSESTALFSNRNYKGKKPRGKGPFPRQQTNERKIQPVEVSSSV